MKKLLIALLLASVTGCASNDYKMYLDSNNAYSPVTIPTVVEIVPIVITTLIEITPLIIQLHQRNYGLN